MGFNISIVETGKLTRITAKSAGYTRARTVPLRRSTRLAEAERANTVANPAPVGESSLPYYVVESISEEDIINASDDDIVEASAPPRKRSRSSNNPVIDVAVDAVDAGSVAVPVYSGEELEESSVSVLDEDLSGEETAVLTQDDPTTETSTNTEEEARVEVAELPSSAVVTQADAEPVQAGEESKESDSVKDVPTEIDESCGASRNSNGVEDAPTEIDESCGAAAIASGCCSVAIKLRLLLIVIRPATRRGYWAAKARQSMPPSDRPNK